jgi:hypothetical protein
MSLNRLIALRKIIRTTHVVSYIPPSSITRILAVTFLSLIDIDLDTGTKNGQYMMSIERELFEDQSELYQLKDDGYQIAFVGKALPILKCYVFNPNLVLIIPLPIWIVIAKPTVLTEPDIYAEPRFEAESSLVQPVPWSPAKMSKLKCPKLDWHIASCIRKNTTRGIVSNPLQCKCDKADYIHGLGIIDMYVSPSHSSSQIQLMYVDENMCDCQTLHIDVVCGRFYNTLHSQMPYIKFGFGDWNISTATDLAKYNESVSMGTAKPALACIMGENTIGVAEDITLYIEF